MKSKFVDKEFTPQLSSLLCKNLPTLSSKEEEFYKTLVWKRPEEFIKGPYTLWNQNPTPFDICQGNIGDCYFLSACSALAEYPNYVKRIFEKSLTISMEGKYTLIIFESGKQKEVIIDDLIPCTKDGVPAFAFPKNNCIWVLLLEKCWAKINKSYQNIIDGEPEEAFTFLTSSPSFIYDHKNIDKYSLFNILQEAHLNQSIMVASSTYSENGNNDIINGIVQSHSYTVLDVRCLNTDKGFANIVHLRNPWSRGEWIGDWSDSSPLWTPNLKSEVNFVNEDEGSFYMSIEDFIMNFIFCVISNVNKYFLTYTRIKELNKREAIFLSLSVPKKTKGFISVSQPSYRLNRIVKQDFQGGLIGIILAKKCMTKTGTFYEFIKGRRTGNNMTYIALPNNKSEEYLIITQGFFNEKFNNELYISGFFLNNAKILELPFDKCIMDSVLGSAAIKTGLVSELDEVVGKPGFPSFQNIISNGSNFGSYLFMNNSIDTFVALTLFYPTFSNLRVNSPTNSVKVYVPIRPQSFFLVSNFILGSDCGFKTYFKKEQIEEVQPTEKGSPLFDFFLNLYKLFAENPNAIKTDNSIEKIEMSKEISPHKLSLDEIKRLEESELMGKKVGAIICPGDVANLEIYSIEKDNILFFGFINKSKYRITFNIHFELNGLLIPNIPKELDSMWNICINSGCGELKKMEIISRPYTYARSFTSIYYSEISLKD